MSGTKGAGKQCGAQRDGRGNRPTEAPVTTAVDAPADNRKRLHQQWLHRGIVRARRPTLCEGGSDGHHRQRVCSGHRQSVVDGAASDAARADRHGAGVKDATRSSSVACVRRKERGRGTPGRPVDDYVAAAAHRVVVQHERASGRRTQARGHTATISGRRARVPANPPLMTGDPVPDSPPWRSSSSPRSPVKPHTWAVPPRKARPSRRFDGGRGATRVLLGAPQTSRHGRARTAPGWCCGRPRGRPVRPDNPASGARTPFLWPIGGHAGSGPGAPQGAHPRGRGPTLERAGPAPRSGPPRAGRCPPMSVRTRAPTPDGEGP